MKRFCGQCGSPIDPRVGCCPKCESQQGQFLWETAMEQEDYIFEDEYSSRRKRKKKSSATLIVILVLALVVLLGTAVGALFYFEVLELPDIPLMLEEMRPEESQEETEPEDPTTAPEETVAPLPAATEPTAVPTEPAVTCPDVKVGDILYMGKMNQDDISSNGDEPIAWIVLDVWGDEVLVVSKNALFSRQYHYADEPVTWESCYLRLWLNEEFYFGAFTDEERERILLTDNTDHDNPQFATDPGEDTRDHVFLLSLTEAEGYFGSNTDRICKPTALAKSQGAYVRASTGGCWWWLRSPGNTSQDAASVNSDGSIDYDDGSVTSQKGCVRPAMWIQIG